MLFLALTPTWLQASDQRSFNDWDIDTNGFVDKQEFVQGVERAGWLERWDANDDRRIGKQEFKAVGFSGHFENWDTDGNGYLDAGELHVGIYSTYDEDKDGEWSLGEWDDASDAGWFDV